MLFRSAYVNNIPGNQQEFFNAIVDQNAWELVGEGYRKYDLIRWNLLGDKIQQMKNDYVAQLDEYPAKLYFKYKEDNATIDMSTVQWYASKDEQDEFAAEGAAEGWENRAFWGAEVTASSQTNLLEYMPSISGGLNSTVINRYVMPIASTTISASNGTLSNSYGFSKIGRAHV